MVLFLHCIPESENTKEGTGACCLSVFFAVLLNSRDRGDGGKEGGCVVVLVADATVEG